jgi:hypothetical protein
VTTKGLNQIVCVESSDQSQGLKLYPIRRTLGLLSESGGGFQPPPTARLPKSTSVAPIHLKVIFLVWSLPYFASTLLRGLAGLAVTVAFEGPYERG